MIFLAITSYVVFPEKKSYKSDHLILDNETLENDLKDFFFTFIELPKFTKEIHELNSLEDLWYYFLKHAEESREIDASLASNAEIKEAYHVLDRAFWTESELQEYDRVAMSVADAKGALVAARKEGIQEGLEEGIQKGLEEGIQKGLEEGIQKGGRQEKLAIAEILLKKQFPLEEVLEITGLTAEELHIFELVPTS